MSFYDAQLEFHVPVFSSSQPIYDLGQQTLPFILKIPNHAEGNFGVVSQYKINSNPIIDWIS